jgi:hypothetical protein
MTMQLIQHELTQGLDYIEPPKTCKTTPLLKVKNERNDKQFSCVNQQGSVKKERGESRLPTARKLLFLNR